VSGGRFAALFVSNVLNGTVANSPNTVNGGTVERLILELHGNRPPELVSHTNVGSGFGERTDQAALVVGPTGLGLGPDGTLYVADSVGNRIAAIRGALVRTTSGGTGTTVTSGGKLNTPLGLAIAPNGDVLTVNAADGLIVETTPAGAQVAHHLLDNTGTPPGNGALFGLALAPHGVYYVDDAANTLRLLH
jgi:DNA-binding beta-propeller fold protein YncE